MSASLITTYFFNLSMTLGAPSLERLRCVLERYKELKRCHPVIFIIPSMAIPT